MSAFRRLSAFSIAFAFTVIMPLNASAAWLEDFVSSAGGAVNITPGQAIGNQHITGYSGGSVVWRVPNKQIHPFQITPPSLKAGCGGIDLFMGSYSFVNKEQFVQALRNFGQAAVGYFFMLALRSMSPEIAVTLETINAIAQKINEFGIGGCKDAMKAVDWAVKKTGVFAQNEAGKGQANKGAVNDFFEGVNNTIAQVFPDTVEQARKNLNRDQPKQPPGKGVPLEVNTVFEAIKQGDQGGNFTTDDINFIMSMFGTCSVIHVSPSIPEGFVDNPKGPKITLEQLIGDTDGTGSYLHMTKCTNEDCTQTSDELVFEKTYAQLAMDVMNKISNAILNKTPGMANLSPKEISILKMSSVPMYRVAALSATNTGAAGGVGASMLKQTAETAATDAALNTIDYFAREIDKFLASTKNIGHRIDIESCRQSISETRKAAYAAAGKIYKKTGTPYEILKRVNELERFAYGTLNQNLAANARFGKRF